MSDAVDPNSEQEAASALPLVAGQVGNTGVWIFGAILAVAAVGLFYGLEMRRNTLSSPNLTVPATSSAAPISSPPELIIPSFAAADPEYGLEIPAQPAQRPVFVTQAAQPVRRIRDAEQEVEPDYDRRPQPIREITRPQTDSNFRPRSIGGDGDDDFLNRQGDIDRKGLLQLTNPGSTIPKGTVIHAILESALDSTRPGSVRAIVSRDVSSFDGSRVLIPKGSRLIGNYEADLARGQKRALIQWNRLMLPEGLMMEIDSPSADPLGRAGVKGKVNSHFFARFGDALMRSVLDTGVQLAGRKVGGDTVILNLPNSQQLDGGGAQNIQPTLKVRHGTSVSVFVAHDLDFSDRDR